MFFQRVLVSLYILLLIGGILLIHEAPRMVAEGDLKIAFLREVAWRYHTERGFPVLVYVPHGNDQSLFNLHERSVLEKGMNSDSHSLEHIASDPGVACMTLSPDRSRVVVSHLLLNSEHFEKYPWDPRPMSGEQFFRFGVFPEKPVLVSFINGFSYDLSKINFDAFWSGNQEEAGLAEFEQLLSQLSPTYSSPVFHFGDNFASSLKMQAQLRLLGTKSVGLLMVIIGLIGLSVWLSQSMQRSREFKPRRFRKDESSDPSDESGDCISGVETLYPHRNQQIGGSGRFNPSPLMLMVDPPEEETDDQRRDRRIKELQNRYFDLQSKRIELSSVAEKLFSQSKNQNLSYREKRALLSRAIDEAKKPEVVIEEVKPSLRVSELRASRNSG